MCISGNTFISDKIRNKYVSGDYFFSKYPHIWGWATWKRAWQLYDVNMTGYNKEGRKIISKYNSSFLEKFYWKRIFNLTSNNKIDTWDYQWLYCIWKNDSLSIQPKYNLVKNIGFGKDSTHTAKSIYQDVKFLNIKKHNLNISRNQYLDKYISKNHFKISFFGFFKKLGLKLVCK